MYICKKKITKNLVCFIFCFSFAKNNKNMLLKSMFTRGNFDICFSISSETSICCCVYLSDYIHFICKNKFILIEESLVTV